MQLGLIGYWYAFVLALTVNALILIRKICLGEPPGRRSPPLIAWPAAIAQPTHGPVLVRPASGLEPMSKPVATLMTIPDEPAANPSAPPRSRFGNSSGASIPGIGAIQPPSPPNPVRGLRFPSASVDVALVRCVEQSSRHDHDVASIVLFSGHADQPQADRDTRADDQILLIRQIIVSLLIMRFFGSGWRHCSVPTTSVCRFCAALFPSVRSSRNLWRCSTFRCRSHCAQLQPGHLHHHRGCGHLARNRELAALACNRWSALPA